MKLYEFEGHNILKKVGIEVPNFVLVSNIDEVKQARKRLKFPIVAKVQVLAGKRGKSGGIKICTTEKQLLSFAKGMIGQSFGGEEVRFMVLAQKIAVEKEYYMSITYDTQSKLPFLMFCEEGGVDIEDIKKRDSAKIIRVEINPLDGPKEKNFKKAFEATLVEKSQISLLFDFALRLWDAFWRYDCRLVEVNPLAKVEKIFLALDVKAILDDAALVRHKDLDVLPKGAISAKPTERELLAKQIDADDYRGSAGSTFIELGGDIAILASGGGASLLVMDAVVAAGGKSANYTEYSGNPPAEKVEKLTKITLSREGLAGCLVCGAVANFTDIYETLRGFVGGLKQVVPRPLYPIVIRRGGPRQKEAYEMLTKIAKKEGYDLHLFGPETPISVACRKMVELSDQYKIRNPKHEIRSKYK